MNRTRIMFFSLIGVAVLVVGLAAFLQTSGVLGRQATQTAATQAQVAPQVAVTLVPSATAAQAAQATTAPATEATAAPTQSPAQAATSANGELLKPVWGPNYKEGDGLGTLVCGAYAFSGDYPLQQIQMAGLDMKRGFHLGIVPFYLNENYVVTAKERVDAMRAGKIDCLLTTFDLFALEDPGIITAFINESAGADQLWARDLTTLNDLKGKRIAVEANGPSEFFVLDLLATVQLKPSDVTLLLQPDQDTAINVFNEGGADAVAGWEPRILAAEKGGGKVLATSRDFRSILGAVVMSPEAMENKRTVIQLFHDAWFEALAQQESDFDGAAKAIADWGNNDYLGVKKESSAADLRLLLGGVAQANLNDNARAFTKVSSVIDRMLSTRKLWAANGHTVPTNDVTKLVDPQFVQAAAAGLQLDLAAPNKFVNTSFSLGRDRILAQPATTTTAGVTNTQGTAAPSPSDIISKSVAVATLPCSRFEFVPNSTTLQPTSQTVLSDCAVAVLKQNLGLYVRVKGSSAWPGPSGAIPRVNVESTARERAQSVIDYLVSQGISRDRFLLEWTLPPQDHWETTDLAKQAQDRFVEITLLAAGL